MRKLVLLTAMVALVSATAYAAPAPGSIALGWVKADAPIGIRYQLAEKIAGDIGIGFFSNDAVAENAGSTSFTVHAGLPIELLSGDRASLAFRPGVTVDYTTYENDDVDAVTDFYVHVWLAVYYAVTDNFGVTAAHGLDIAIEDQGDDNTTDIYSIAGDAFNVGWFYWF
jgi:hypothetical protein